MYIRGYTVKKGDILITNGTSSSGLLGHAAIANGNEYILDIPGKGETTRQLTTAKWMKEYDGKGWVKVYRLKNSSVANDAANWADKNYYSTKGTSKQNIFPKYGMTGSRYSKTQPIVLRLCFKLIISELEISLSYKYFLHLSDGSTIELGPDDDVIMTNACMTDSATLGDMNTPAPKPEEKPISGELWYKVAQKKPNLGNPEPFFGHEEETNWQSFTVTCHGDKLLKRIERFTGNIPGSGALMTFKDSNWLMSTVVAAQPHFKAQDANTTIFWGYGLYPDRVGDFVKKPMKECTGEEILYELMCHLNWQDDFEEIKADIINVIPCYMPYIDAQFEPRAMSDRPSVVPEGSTNFAMISQFVEIPKDMVFTEEYSVRAARIAVYTLLDIDKKICPVTPHNRDPKVLAKATQTMFR